MFYPSNLQSGPKFRDLALFYRDSLIGSVTGKLYWTEPSQAVVRRVQSEAIMAVKAAFDAADINIPYPIRTVYHYDQQEFNDDLPSNSKEYANHH